MTAFFPSYVARFLAAHSTVADSVVTGSIGVTLLISLLIAREIARTTGERDIARTRLRGMDAVTVPLIVVIAVVIAERFLTLK